LHALAPSKRFAPIIARSTRGSSRGRSRLAKCASDCSTARPIAAACGCSFRLKSLKEFGHLRRDVAAFDRHRHVCDHEAGGASAIVTLTVEPVGMKWLRSNEPRHRVSQLDLSARASLLRVEG